METKFNILKSENGGKIEFTISGQIDEDSDFGQVSIDTIKEAIFDFSKVKMINSCGIREWIKFLNKIPTTIPIHYKNCPQILIEQMNMVHGFVPANAQIDSFFAPYFCEKCDKEHKILIESKNVKNDQAPKLNCPTCSGPLEFDALEKQYFQFIHRK